VNLPIPRNKVVGLLMGGLVALVMWFLTAQGVGTGDDDRSALSTPTPTPSASSSATASAMSTYDDEGGSAGGVDPESGLPWVALDELPPEASETIALIDEGGPFPYDRDGVVFENREELLPDHPVGYYDEYTVETPGSDDRGARRVVTGSADEYYWTEDHYASFERIQR